MKIDNDSFIYRQMPIFLEKTKIVLEYLHNLNYEELKSIWKCSDKLVKHNFDIVKKMDLHNNLTPAILSFEGLQYQYIRPGIFTYDQLDYIGEHLRILSGFYGILHPFDGIVPYRLEMQSKLLDWKYKTLYDFWGNKIAKNIFAESNIIINLASKEYSKSITKYLSEKTKIINCVFGQSINGKIVEKGTLVKMARGEMVRFMAENDIKEFEDIKEFNRLNYIYNKNLSDDYNYIFTKDNT